MGSGTLETRLGMATLAVKNLLAALDGELMPAELDLHSKL
jgi:glyoxylate/hydroxypyruvate reductase